MHYFKIVEIVDFMLTIVIMELVITFKDKHPKNPSDPIRQPNHSSFGEV